MKHELHEGTLTLEIPTDLLSTTVPAVRSEMPAIMERTESHGGPLHTLIVNLRAAHLIDSAGVNFLVSLIRICEARGWKLGVQVTSSTVYRALMFTRLDKHLGLVMIS